MTDKLEGILVTLAEELINYDQRMTASGAPNVRFTHKYTSKATAAIQALIQEAYERGIKVNADARSSAQKNAYNRGHSNGAFKALSDLKRDVMAVDFKAKGYDVDDVNTIWLGNIYRLQAALTSKGEKE